MPIEWADTLRTWRRAYQAEGKGRLADLLARGSGNDSDPRQFSAWLPYRAYDPDGALFQNRDGVGFCLDVLPQAGADERMAEILQSLYANCPPGAGIQIHLFASPAVRGMLTRYANLRIKDSDHLQKMQAEGRPVRQENIFRALGAEARRLPLGRRPPVADPGLSVHGARLPPGGVGAFARSSAPISPSARNCSRCGKR